MWGQKTARLGGRLISAVVLIVALGSASAITGDAHGYEQNAVGGQAQQSDGNLAELKSELQKAESAKGKDSPDLLPLLRKIGDAYNDTGGYVLSAPYLERALSIAEKEHGPRHIAVAGYLEFVGMIYYMQRDAARAKEYWERGLAIAQETVGSNHHLYGIVLHHVGMALLALGKTQEAEEALTKSIEILSMTTGPVSGSTVRASETLAELYLTTGQYSRAHPLLRVALAVRSGALITSAQFQTPTKNLMGSLYAAAGLHDIAEPLLRDAEDAFVNAGLPSHPELEGILVNLAALYDAMKRPDRAATYRQRAQEIHDGNAGFSHHQGTPLRNALAAASIPDNVRGAYANAQVGDWATYSQGDDMSKERVDVVKKTSTAVVLRVSSREFGAEDEKIVGLAERIEDIYGVPGATANPGQLSLGDSKITCLVLVSEIKQAGESFQLKLYFNPDSIPMDGLIRLEVDGEMMTQIKRYRFAGRPEQTFP